MALRGAKRKRGHARGMGSPPRSGKKHMIKLLLLSALFLSSAHAWTRDYGGCTFSGPGTLVRTGSCPDVGGTVNLAGRGITAKPMFRALVPGS